jgi:ABC-2 type transport system permease protein
LCGWDLSIMTRYWRIYKKLFAINLAKGLAFRAHFFLLILFDLFFYTTAILTIDFLFRQIGPIAGWTREHFLFFIAFMLTVEQFHMAFISEAFWQFSYEVRTGRLDYVLLKPVNPIFLTFFRFIRVGSMPLLVIPVGVLIYYGIGLQLSLLSWIMIPFLVVLTLAVLTTLEILLMMSTFWMTDSTSVNFIRMQLQDISRWPDFVYQPIFRRVFTLAIPILLASTAPVRFLFENSGWVGLLAVGAAQVILMAAVGMLWRIGLRRYDSVSA